MEDNANTEIKLSKAQQRVIDALKQPKAYIVHPQNSPGKRTGYVTIGGLGGWICPVHLSTYNKLKSLGLL